MASGVAMFVLAVVVVLVVVLTNGPDTSTPEGTAEAVADAFADKDAKALAAVFVVRCRESTRPGRPFPTGGRRTEYRPTGRYRRGGRRGHRDLHGRDQPDQDRFGQGERRVVPRLVRWLNRAPPAPRRAGPYRLWPAGTPSGARFSRPWRGPGPYLGNPDAAPHPAADELEVRSSCPANCSASRRATSVQRLR